MVLVYYLVLLFFNTLSLVCSLNQSVLTVKGQSTLYSLLGAGTFCEEYFHYKNNTPFMQNFCDGIYMYVLYVYTVALFL